MRKILLSILLILLLLILMLPLVTSHHDDLQYTLQNDILRVNDNIIFIYNTTLHNDEDVGLFIEYDDVMVYLLNITETGTITNQKLEYKLNNTGIYYIGTFFTDRIAVDTSFQYRETIEVKNAKLEAFPIALFILSFFTLIMGFILTPVFILLSLIFLIGGLTITIFTFSYILSPILIGVIALIYILLMVLAERVIRHLM